MSNIHEPSVALLIRAIDRILCALAGPKKKSSPKKNPKPKPAP